MKPSPSARIQRGGALCALAVTPIILFPSCREPTQIRLEITTDVPCGEVTATGIVIGAGSLSQQPTTTQTEHCSQGQIGSLVLVPSDSDDAKVNIEVVLGAGRSPDDCRSDLVKTSCIVARRSVRYTPHSPVVLPIHLSAQCLGVDCADAETCKEGVCVPVAGASSQTDGSAGPDVDGGNEADAEDASAEAATGAPLNAACVADGDCAARLCFDFTGSIGRRCVQSCGSSAECPPEFTCYPYRGAKLCAHVSLFGNSSFASGTGEVCAINGDCKSRWCDGVCLETCASSDDCSAGSCNYRNLSLNPLSDEFAAGCVSDVGAAAVSAPCSADSACRSGVCAEGACRALCGGTADCSGSDVCARVDRSKCLNEFAGYCYEWLVNSVSACMPATGTDPPGTPCTGPTCRDLCVIELGTCAEVCASNSDCGGTTFCSVQHLENLVQAASSAKVFVNVCQPP